MTTLTQTFKIADSFREGAKYSFAPGVTTGLQ